jgi:hypothetical protein
VRVPFRTSGDTVQHVSTLPLRRPKRAEPGQSPREPRQALRAGVGELFPPPAEPPDPGAGLPRWAVVLIQIAVIALGAVVMLVRVGGRPVWETVYAEDPGIYLPWALGHPWHLFEAYGGYLQLVPRLIGQVAALLPVRDASVPFAVGGALVASGCALFTYHASAGQVSSRKLRVLLGLSVLLLPVAQLEIADTGVNSIWYLLAVLFWAALWRPRSRTGAVVAGVVAFAAAASTSLAFVLAPLFLARAVSVPRRIREHAATAGWALGCALQVVVIAAGHQSRFIPRNPINAVLFYAHDVLLPALGWHLSWHLRGAIGVEGATVLVGGLIAVVLAAGLATQARRCQVFVVTAVLTGLVFSGITSAIAWGGPNQQLTVAVEHGARYSTVPILLLVAAVIVVADAYAGRWWPRPKAVVAITALVAVLAVGWVSDFRYPVQRATGPPAEWALIADQWLAYCQHKPTGTIMVTFTNWWGKGLLYNSFRCSSLRR